MTVNTRIAGISLVAHSLLWGEVVAMDRREYLWVQSVILLCGVLFTAAGAIYVMWGRGPWLF